MNHPISRIFKIAVIGFLTGIIGLAASIRPAGPYLEENIGLELLFHLRGERKPPSDVVVVGIDRESSDSLNLHERVERWSRTLHARLVQNLVKAGAAVIVFDVFFQDAHGEEEDKAFAEAIADARNVVLCQALKKDSIPATETSGIHTGNVIVESLLTPIPQLAQSAAALAPFPLPKLPLRVNQYWAFKGVEARPTIPVVAFQVFTLELYDCFLHLLEKASPSLAARLPSSRDEVINAGGVGELIACLRENFTEDPLIADKMLEALSHPEAPAKFNIEANQIARLKALIKMYKSPESRHLNFYGPSGTITTIPYHQVLRQGESEHLQGKTLMELNGKAVFIGASGKREIEQRDVFYTVFSQQNGLDLSGVEIAATAFTNILEDVHIKPLGTPLHIAFIFLWGLAFGIICCLFPAFLSALTIAAALTIYFLIAQYRFENAAVWYPFIVPSLIQAPFAFFGSVLWKYVDATRERRNIKKAFGLYVPDNVAERLAKDISSMKAHSEVVYGTCLSTDGDRYATLSENMHPRDLAVFLNRYYETVFEQVREYGGLVTDIVGDSMMAIWKDKRDDTGARSRACQAALAIDGALRCFNESSGPFKLPTRMGLHSGQMSLGNIGGVNHYEYRPVGDAINTASRIENVNKYLGTKILASGEALSGLDCFLTRELGEFLLAGKSKPVVLYELICHMKDSDLKKRKLCAVFAQGLNAYRMQSWEEAMERFRRAMAIYGSDGPSRFYIALCEQYRRIPAQMGWDGLIRLRKK